MATQFEDTLAEKGFSIYPKDLIARHSNNPDMGELLVSSERLSPLLKALEDENVILKEEVGHLSHDLKRFISLVEFLLEENNVREFKESWIEVTYKFYISISENMSIKRTLILLSLLKLLDSTMEKK